MTRFRDELAFPAEHMRLIGEICVQWTHVELCVLQVVCEANNIDARTGMYLGGRVSFGDRIGLLEAMSGVLKDEATSDPQYKETAKALNVHLQALRKAYLVRNKYAHAELSPGIYPFDDPVIHFAQFTQKLRLENRGLTLKEMEADSDAIHDVATDFITFAQELGFLQKAWL